MENNQRDKKSTKLETKQNRQHRQPEKHKEKYKFNNENKYDITDCNNVTIS